MGRLDEWRSGLFTETGIPEVVVAIPGIGQLSGITGPIIGPMMERFVFPAHFSSAHPVYDPDTGEVFTNNLNFVANDADDPSARFTHLMRAQNPNSVLWIVHRAELKAGGGRARAVKAVVPGEAGHFTADYANPNGRLVTYFTHLIATDLSEWVQPNDVRFDNGAAVRRDLLGLLPSGNDVNTVGKHVIDGATGRLLDSRTVADDEYMWATLFRRIPLDKLPNKEGRMSNLPHGTCAPWR